MGDKFIYESIIGSQFIGKIEVEKKVGEFNRIIPSIEGWAKVYWYKEITIDEKDDPMALGFQVI